MAVTACALLQSRAYLDALAEDPCVNHRRVALRHPQRRIANCAAKARSVDYAEGTIRHATMCIVHEYLKTTAAMFEANF